MACQQTANFWSPCADEARVYVDQTPTRIRVYTYAGNQNWAEYQIGYYDTTGGEPPGSVVGGANYRGWRTDSVWLCTRSGTVFTRRLPVTAVPGASGISSEFDIAIQEVGASDFVGGRVHGDHLASAATLTADGVSVPVDQTAGFWCGSFVLSEASSLKRNVDTATELATAAKTMTYTRGLYRLGVLLTWKFAANINNCYIGMLPVARDDATYGQITSSSTQWPSGTVKDCSLANFTETINTDSDVRIVGASSGLSVQGRAVSGWGSALRRFRVSNNAGSNKLYWKQVDGNVTAETTIDAALEFRVRDNR